MNEVIHTIYNRRAVRKYTDQELSSELIEQLLSAGRMAPSAMGKEPWRFYILQDKTKIKRYSKAIMRAGKHMIPKLELKTIVKTTLTIVSHLSTVLDFVTASDPVFHGAPVVVFITAKKGDEWAALDIGMCSQNIMLAAKSLGLDTCPIGFAKLLEKTDEYAELNLPLDQVIHLAIIVGYGDEQPKVHPRDESNTYYL